MTSLRPQYKGLQSLYDKLKDQGLEIVGFPCNQFGGQEPGSNEEIEQFCSRNYSVTFPVMDKIDVKLFYFRKSQMIGEWR